MGTELPVIGPKVNNNWIPVLYKTSSGMILMGVVFDEYVELKTVTQPVTATQAAPTTPRPASPMPSASPSPGMMQPQQQQWRVNSPEGLNLRAAPSLDARVVTVIPHNTRLTLSGHSPDGKWASATYNGQLGWVDTTYLVLVDERTEQPAAGRFVWPVSGRSITTYFSGGHPGIDVDQFPNGGNPVVAIAAGKVTFVGGNACCSYGLYVKVEHKDGAESLYAHLQTFDVREGQEVTQGQTLGKSGNTGYSTGPHLHFELRINGSAVDPLAHLPR